jgi:hypothetical protein
MTKGQMAGGSRRAQQGNRTVTGIGWEGGAPCRVGGRNQQETDNAQDYRSKKACKCFHSSHGISG